MCGRVKGGTLNVSLPWCPFSGCCSSLGSKAGRLRVGLEVIMHGKKSHVDNDDMQFDLESIFWRMSCSISDSHVCVSP